MSMTSKQRMLTAIEGGVPDRLPVATHDVMPYFLNKYMDGISNDEFYDYFGFDPILYTYHCKSGESDWRIESEQIPHTQYKTVRYRFVTPKGQLTTVLQSNEQTSWVTERLIKEKNDIDIIAEFVTTPKCDVEAVNADAEAFGQRGLVRAPVCGFDMFGQPGCWQDACCLVGTEKLIMATYDDPQWVHQLLAILQKRKLGFIKSLKGARYDILELGGGSASTSLISPKLFNDFVAPYDTELIAAAHQVGQRIVYHTCGSMMAILEDIAAMGPDAMETFTPPGMGADVDLAEAKRRIGQKVCMIGGFDQFHFFVGCEPQETRAAVRDCFRQAGENGGFILCPSDHFFDADIELLKAFVDEAKKCTY